MKETLIAHEYYNQGEYETALKYFLVAVASLAPEQLIERSQIHSSLAACYLKLKKLDLAKKECDKALEMNPNFVKAIYRRAQTHEAQANLIAALMDYEAIVALEPHNEEALSCLEVIKAKICTESEKHKRKLFILVKKIGEKFAYK